MVCVNEEQLARICAVPHFARGQYAGLDIVATLEFYRKRYVEPLKRFCRLDDETMIADIGTGYGWLPMALVAFTPARVVAVDADFERLAAGREIAAILGLDRRIDWQPGCLGDLPLADQSADIVYCIEVLEHVYGERAALADLSRVAREHLIVTTPNKWFPVLAHDTRLPLCHLLPLRLREIYARLCGRTDSENDNLFWSPRSLQSGLGDFKRVSRFLHYGELDDFLATYPLYLPYGRGRQVERPSRAQIAYYKLAARSGSWSHIMLPNLAGVWRRARSFEKPGEA